MQVVACRSFNDLLFLPTVHLIPFYSLILLRKPRKRKEDAIVVLSDEEDGDGDDFVSGHPAPTRVKLEPQRPQQNKIPSKDENDDDFLEE